MFMTGDYSWRPSPSSTFIVRSYRIQYTIFQLQVASSNKASRINFVLSWILLLFMRIQYTIAVDIHITDVLSLTGVMYLEPSWTVHIVSSFSISISVLPRNVKKKTIHLIRKKNFVQSLATCNSHLRYHHLIHTEV